MANTGQDPIPRITGDNTDRLLVIIFTMAFLILFILDLNGKIKVDGWAIVLLILALFPWIFPSLIIAIRSLSVVFADSSIRSLQLGSLKIEMLEKKVSEQSEKIYEQQKLIDDLVMYTMAWYILDKLKYICLGTIDKYRSEYGEYKYTGDEPTNHDLRFLRDHGYLEMFQLNDLKYGDNLVGRLRATEMGRRFVELHGYR